MGRVPVRPASANTSALKRIVLSHRSAIQPPAKLMTPLAFVGRRDG
jgi:hypothetical protein